MARIPAIVRPALLLLIFFAVMTILSLLPVVPVYKGTTVRPEMASVRLTFASLADLFMLFYDMPVGIWYQPNWYSLAAIVALVASGLWITKKITRWFYN